ncbi:MAG: hypothetical protein K2M34_00500 [Alphaproteobacteria bacterium]|nr:hypothetical protein [Alphaproteobacteria bacterium]
MKHLIAIFSVILTLGVVVPSDGWGATNCNPVACDGPNNSEVINVLVGGGKTAGSGLCFYCENSYAGDSNCGDHHIAGQKNTNGLVTKIYSCDDGASDSWLSTSSTAICAGSDLSLTTISDSPSNNYTCSYSLDGSTYNYSYVNGASTTSGIGNVCVMCKCRSGYRRNAAGTDCEVDRSAQETCTNSGGQWDAANTKCLCGTDRSDDKGEGQTYDSPGASCKCSDATYSWNDSQGKCVAPDAAEVEACSESGGRWEGGQCICNETTLTQSSDKKTCVRNDAYYLCTGDDSGGDWISGSCKCDTSKGLTGPRDGKCYCSNSTEIYDPAPRMCVRSAETWCRQTGGEWNATSGTCNCDIPSKNIKEKSGSSPTQCECINEDYKPDDPSSNGCKLTDEAALRIQTFERLRDACIYDWNMTFTPMEYDRTWEPKNWMCNCDADRGLKQTDNKLSCKCDDTRGYVLDSARAPYSCRLTDYDTARQNCDAAIAAGTNAKWVDNGVINGRHVGECKCKDAKQGYNYATKQCLDNDTMAAWCAMIPGAAVARDGRCLCRTTGREPVNYKCQTAGGATSGSTAGSVPPVDTSKKKQKITDAAKALKEISDGFGRSHWKTASGNFNGARLASDSIAGVVLGTVGGVVTSNIIKKNQVKGGFESLNCAVGGQMVADYGDQFQVGIH